MRPTGLIGSLGAMAVAGALTLAPASTATATAPVQTAATAVSAETRPAAAGTEVAISPVDLDGPAISTVKVTVTNAGPQRMRALKVTFGGPVGWAVQPSAVQVDGALAAGASAVATFRIQVPEKRAGFTIRTFTATATYQGGDGAGSATATRTERSGTPLPGLAAAYNNVGVTDESDTRPGNYDGEGNSFSAQKLAAVGLRPGEPVSALGATLRWPDVPSGTRNNVSSAGQAITLAGSGSRLVLLGSGVTSGASGTVTVSYTDGTSDTGTIGFPNWSFDPANAHGATLVASSDGRNRPSGYGNAGIAYRVFAHSVPLDPAKQVEFVVLPANGNVHVFDLAIAP
ncbi:MULTISPECIES: NEW3 domain-containing protein [Streptomyces]|uniref:NEW3 domain-containing protein n=2 Tax=Streptomyces TaxID=1883 RepID=A0ABU4K830_9ACTN|nr:NEW3 domain-containing protein [Streptomyces roseolus]MDX2293597.1 NEW3 domain-containing protein [Streptomyces roseolus]